MIIIETCPKCGHDLVDEVICTYPPIPRKVCYGCGWSWEGKREEVVRVPFGGNSNDYTDNSYLDNNITLLNNYNLDDSLVSKFEQTACASCPSNPKNGGDGICFCTLGQLNIVY